MAEEKNTGDEQEGLEESDVPLRAFNKGCSRFSRASENASINDWLSRKGEMRSKQSGESKARRSGLKAKSSLRQVSKNQQKKNSDYSTAKTKHYSLEENQSCFLCGKTEHLSVHHVSKRGNNIADQSKFMTLCLMGNFMDKKYPDSNHSHQGGCHSWVEANKSISRELKLII